jgi:hypothetical protein
MAVGLEGQIDDPRAGQIVNTAAAVTTVNTEHAPIMTIVERNRL